MKRSVMAIVLALGMVVFSSVYTISANTDTGIVKSSEKTISPNNATDEEDNENNKTTEEEVSVEENESNDANEIVKEKNDSAEIQKIENDGETEEIQNVSKKTASSIDEFISEFNSANNGDVISLTNAISTEIRDNSNASITLNINAGDTRNLTIDGTGVTLDGNNVHNGIIFNVSHNGSGTITYKNINIKNINNSAFDLKGSGNTLLENVSVSNSTTNSIDSNVTGTITIKSSTFINTNGFADKSTTVNHKIIAIDNYFSGATSSAFYINGNAIATVSNTTFENNFHATGYNGGAIATSPESSNISLTVSNSYFYRNKSQSGTGGAIAIYHLSNSDIIIEDCVFEENQAVGGSGITIADGGAISIKNNSTNYSNTTVTIRNNSLNNNISDDNGGAILVEASNGGTSKAIIYNNTFVGNIAKNLGSTSGGGAIQTYETPETMISHNTFYRNMSEKNAGGGAIMLYGNWRNSSVISPLVANNIFVDNNYDRPSTQTNRNVGKLFVTANVNNNGNVGYDAGSKFVPDDPTRNDLVKVENIFTEFDDSEIAVPIQVTGIIGSQNHTTYRTAYIPSPRIDEMLRTNDPRIVTGVLTDVRGYPRESLTPDNPYYPNAGAVEIYWTKFDPGAISGKGNWSSRFNVEAEGGIESLAYPGVFYKINNPPTYVNGVPSYEENHTFTRNTLQGATDFGFASWYDEAKDETKDVNELYYARKQTYVAIWEQDTFHLDFDLKGGSALAGHENDFNTQVIKKDDAAQLGIEPISNPILDGYVFDGWYTDDTIYTTKWDFTKDKVEEDITLYAKWHKINKCTLSFDMQGHGDQIEPESIDEGNESVKPDDPIANGYDFDGWYTDTTFTEQYEFNTPLTKDLTVYAEWEYVDVYYNVEFISNGGTKINPQRVKENEKAIRPSNPTKEGYIFLGWVLKGETDYYDFSTLVTNDIILEASWEKKVEPNKPKPNNPKPNNPTNNSPNTGDSTSENIYFLLLILAGIVLVKLRNHKFN